MQYIIVFILCFSLISCSGSDLTNGIVEISGTLDGTEVVRGMGVCIARDTLLTSAHVVRDDRVTYRLRIYNDEGSPKNALVIERDMETDIAYMRINSEEGTMKGICRTYKEYIGKNKLKLGEKVYVPVSRSASLIVLSGGITSLTGYVLAYDILGRTESMTGLLMTDIVLLPGDSGTPILDGQGKVVDVVHVE